MERSHAGPLRSGSGSGSGIDNGALEAPNSSDDRRVSRRVSYGLGLLLLALIVGLAAALFLTVGTANADGAREAEFSNPAVCMAGAKSAGPAPRSATVPLIPSR